MYKITTVADYNPADYPGETNTGELLVIPDQSLTVEQILERHAKGLSSTHVKVPIYTSNTKEIEEMLPDFNKMDLAEIQLLKQATHERIEQIKREMYERVAKDKEEAQKRFLEAKIEEALKNSKNEEKN